MLILFDSGENKTKKRKLDVTPSKSSESIKSQKTISSKSIKSQKTIASAQNWYESGEITKFKISFIDTSASSEKAFNDFFENIEIDVEKYNKLIEGSWGETDKNNKSISEAGYIFQVTCSEVSVKAYVRLLLTELGLLTEDRTKCTFGKIDMICSGLTFQSAYRSSAIENKCGGTFNKEKIKAYRAQLSSYLISIALSNQETSEERKKAFEYQNLIGIVHFGLTPIYFKTKISRSYLNVVQHMLKNGENEELPKLEIFQFTPFDSFFCDREVYYHSKKLKIIKTYVAFKALLAKYDTEKKKQM